MMNFLKLGGRDLGAFSWALVLVGRLFASEVICLWAKIKLPVLPCVWVCVSMCASALLRCVSSVCATPPRSLSSCLFLSNILLLFASIYATESSSSTPEVHLVSLFLSRSLSLCLLVSVFSLLFSVSVLSIRTEPRHLYIDVCMCAFVRQDSAHSHVVFFTLL